MKSLATTMMLVLAFAVPALAGYHPPKAGGPRSSRGAGTRIFTPQPIGVDASSPMPTIVHRAGS